MSDTNSQAPRPEGEQPKPAQPRRIILCPECGHPSISTAPKCKHCGYPIAGEPEEPETPAPVQESEPAPEPPAAPPAPEPEPQAAPAPEPAPQPQQQPQQQPQPAYGDVPPAMPPSGQEFGIPVPRKSSLSSTSIAFICIGGLLGLGLLIWAAMTFLSGAGGEKPEAFSRSFSDFINYNQRDSLAIYYPEIQPTDSLIAFLPADNVTISDAGSSGLYTVSYSPDVSILVKSLGNGRFKVLESHGLFVFQDDMIDYARSQGIWKESASDVEARDLLRDPDFVDRFMQFSCVLTDERIRDIIKNNKCTAAYNIVGRLYQEAAEAELEYGGGGGDPWYRLLDTYNIISQDDNNAVLHADYIDEYTGRKQYYIVTLKKEKIRDSNGHEIYVWLIDDIANHPDYNYNRADRANYINSVYDDIRNHGTPEAYWNDVAYSEYHDVMFDSREEYLKAAHKFINDLKQFYPSGTVR